MSISVCKIAESEVKGLTGNIVSLPGPRTPIGPISIPALRKSEVI